MDCAKICHNWWGKCVEQKKSLNGLIYKAWENVKHLKHEYLLLPEQFFVENIWIYYESLDQ